MAKKRRRANSSAAPSAPTNAPADDGTPIQDSREGDAHKCPSERVEKCEDRFRSIELEVFGKEQPPSPEPGAITRYFVIIFWEREQRHSINRPLYDHLHEQLDATIKTPQENTEIDVWIDSGGGDPHVAYKLLLDLRSRCRTLRAVIPDYAKSAATLLVLGMDEIYMAAPAELGPLDVQVAHPLREDLTVSALDVSGAIEYIGRLAVSLAAEGGPVLLNWTGLARADILHEVLPFAAKIVEPAVKQLDPHLVHRARSQLRITSEYAERALAGRRVDEADKLDQKRIEDLCLYLVTNYPSHGFVISANEAKEFGLPIKELTAYYAAPLVNAIYTKYSEEQEDVCQVIKAAGGTQAVSAAEGIAALQPNGRSEDVEADGQDGSEGTAD